MAAGISRRKLADYVASQVLAGEKLANTLDELAAFLVETGRTREVDLVVRTIEQTLAERGVVVAEVTSALPLDASVKKRISEIVGAKKLHLRETVDPSVLGGIKLDIPGARADTTLKRKINALRAQGQM